MLTRIAAYLDVYMEEGGDGPTFITHALGVVARARNMSQLARATGMTREGLYKALSGNGNPSFSTVMKVAQALSLRLQFRSGALTDMKPAGPAKRGTKMYPTFEAIGLKRLNEANAPVKPLTNSFLSPPRRRPKPSVFCRLMTYRLLDSGFRRNDKLIKSSLWPSPKCEIE